MMLEKTRSRRLTPKKKTKTSDEKSHLAKIAAMPCCVCGSIPVTIHHCGTYMGGGRSHMKILPLCVKHHLIGPEAIDGKMISKGEWEGRFGTEEDLLASLQAKIQEILK